uniref:PEST proteolytic signal-containing nuclear protein n=1 Tax=Rhabditophanes sp. KR3021 TaxID=114890 RepID=A0AC35TNW1_9BILA
MSSTPQKTATDDKCPIEAKKAKTVPEKVTKNHNFEKSSSTGSMKVGPFAKIKENEKKRMSSFDHDKEEVSDKERYFSK